MAANKIEDLKEGEFHQKIGNGVMVVGFWAPWCHTCHAVMPMLDELSSNFDKAKFYKVNVVENPGLASRYGVMSLPNILIFKENKVFEQIIGSTNKKAIQEKVQRAL